MSVYANEGFYALSGFAKVVGAIDGSLVPIITPINASVHPPHETIDRVTCHLSSFVFLLFLLHSASLCTLYLTLSAIIPNDNVDYVNVIHVFTEDTLSINSTRFPSSGLHRMRCACV